jgi:membrane associated rhomboid family serine protease
MDNLINQTQQTIQLLQKNMLFVFYLIGILFAIHLLNWLTGYRLNLLGIWPRKLLSLPGILFAPFLHGDFNHLFFNCIPLFIMVSFVLLNGMAVFLCVSAIIILIGGLATWVFGRKGIHIGASGVIMGYWGFLLIQAYLHPTVVSIALAIVCLYYFGGMIFNLFPTRMKSSWEAHLFGFLAGLTAFYACPIILSRWGLA